MTKLSLQFSGKCFQQLCWVIWVSTQKKNIGNLTSSHYHAKKIPKCVIDQNMKAETVKIWIRIYDLGVGQDFLNMNL